MLAAMNMADAEAAARRSAARRSAARRSRAAPRRPPPRPLPSTPRREAVRSCSPSPAAGGWTCRRATTAARRSCPPAPLSPEKQTRLCLTAEHTACPTYLASLAARTARLGSTPGDRATRWGLARTTTVIEDPGGVRARGCSARRSTDGDGPRFPPSSSSRRCSRSPCRDSAPTSRAQRSRRPAPGLRPRRPRRPLAAPHPRHPRRRRPRPRRRARPPHRRPHRPRRPRRRRPTFRTYTVATGDTLSAIAARFDTTVAAIVNLNDLEQREQPPRRPGRC